MEIEFKDKNLAVLLTSRAAAESNLPIAVIRSFRAKYNFLRSAKDERDLRNWKSLHLEKLNGYSDDRRSVRLNDQWRLIFTINTDLDPPKLVMLSVEDYH